MIRASANSEIVIYVSILGGFRGIQMGNGVQQQQSKSLSYQFFISLRMKSIVILLLMAIEAQQQVEHCQWSKIDTAGVERCTVCVQGYQLNLNYSQCNLCTSLHSSCLKCQSKSSQLQCQVCDYGYYLSNNTCAPFFICQEDSCLICLQDSSCNYCKQGYYLNYTTNRCQPCAYPDMYDTYNQQCACDFGYYLNVSLGLCLKCSAPCQQCQSGASSCTRCVYGYFLSPLTQPPVCSPCLVPNCILCSSSQLCLNCTLGYHLTPSNTCQIQLQTLNIQNYINLPEIYYFCQEGCFYCYKYDFCLTCLEGYERDVRNDTCVYCGGGCSKCNIALLAVQCRTCLKGYRLDAEQGVCIACPEQCLQCNQLGCQQCQQGYTQQAGQCLACAQNCLKCDQQGPSNCDPGSCSSRYARVNPQECALCALGCYSCSSVDISTCLSCPLGSFQVQGGQCQICPNECTTCSDGATCLTCRAGFRLVYSKCQPICVYPCLQCSPFNPNICSSCFMGYSLTQDLTCKSDISCNKASNCSICPLGYFLTSLKTCLTCQTQPNCLKCQTQSSRCVICEQGYYSQLHTCRKCSAECQTCQLFSRCFSCKGGSYLLPTPNQVYGECLPCSSTCLSCLDQPQKCVSCTLDKVLIGFSCITNQNIIFQLTLQHRTISEDSAMEIALIKEIVAFTRFVAIGLGEPFQSNTELLHIKDITSGSVIITYMAESGRLDPRVVLASITKQITTLTTYDEFTVIGSQIVANGFQEDKIVEPGQGVVYLSLAPAPVILVLIVISLCHLRRSRYGDEEGSEKEEGESEQEGGTEEEGATHKKSQKGSEGMQIQLQPLESQKNLKGEPRGAITL